MSLFSFQGKVLLALRQANGKPASLRWVGNVPTCQLALTTDTTDKKESYTGQRLTIGRLQTGKTAALTVTFDEWSAENLALGLHGVSTQVAGGSVTSEAFPAGVLAGDNIMLEHAGVSALVITDSASTPATVTPTKYSLSPNGSGVIQMLDVTGFTQPFKAAYTYAAGSNVTMFTQTPAERYFVLDGINTETGESVRVRLYRVKFDPISQLDLINEEYGSLPMTGSVLYDALNAADPLLGGFGRIESGVVTSG